MFTYNAFHKLVFGHPRPVILIEGTRELPADDRPRLVAFARWLAQTYPHATFRTGNAKGADEAFAEGVECIDPARLEYVLPYAGHRKKAAPSPARRVALDAMPSMAEKKAAYTTEQASPEYASLLAKHQRRELPSHTQECRRGHPPSPKGDWPGVHSGRPGDGGIGLCVNNNLLRC